MNKNILLITLVILIAVIGGYFFFSAGGNMQAPNDNQDNNTTTEENTLGNGDLSTEENVKTFEVLGTNFKFSVEEIRVKKGDTVRITFTSESGFHDWVIDEFNARTKQLQTSGSETIEFIADKAGEFEYYCSVGSHREMGMVGKLIVEE